MLVYFIPQNSLPRPVGTGYPETSLAPLYILFMLHLYYSPTYPVGPANECLQKIRRTGYVVFVLE